MNTYARTRFKEGKIYLFKPPTMKVNIECGNLLTLDTTVENTLLKDNFIGAVRAHGEPQNIHEGLKEFHRILKKDGSLSLIVPYSCPQGSDYPLTMWRIR